MSVKLMMPAGQLRPLAVELLNPAAFTLFALAVWCLLSSLRLAGTVPFTGLLAHWMFWLAAGIVAAAARRRLEV